MPDFEQHEQIRVPPEHTRWLTDTATVWKSLRLNAKGMAR